MTSQTPSRLGPLKRAALCVGIASAPFLVVRSSAAPDQAQGEEAVHEPSFDRTETMTADLDETVDSEPPQTQAALDPPSTDHIEGAVVTEAGVQEAGGNTAGPPLTYEGHPLRKVRDVIMLVTAYSPDERSCGIWARFGVTASGKTIQTNHGKLVAADTNVLPFGSIVTVPGYHASTPVPVLDRGSKVKGNHIDLLFPTHAQAVKWGVKRLRVTVWELAD